MDSEANSIPTNSIRKMSIRKLKNETGATPMKYATTSIKTPLIIPLKAPQRISPAIASSAETGVAMSES